MKKGSIPYLFYLSIFIFNFPSVLPLLSAMNTDDRSFGQKAMGEDSIGNNFITYAVPPEYPLEGRQRFNVSVNGVYTGLYNDNNLWGGNVNFGYFDFEAGTSMEITVTYKKVIRAFEILPVKSGITAEKIAGNQIRFTINQPDSYFTVVVNDNYKGDILHLFANSIDKNIPDVQVKEGYFYDRTKGIHYFGAGYYKLSDYFSNGTLSINKNKTIYLAGGAVLDGQLSLHQSTTAQIRGRGMIMNQQEDGVDNRVVVAVSASQGGSIEGILIHGHRAPGWVCTNDKSSNISYKNVKIISTRYASTDGIDINQCTDMWFENMFIRSCDDAVAIKGLASETMAPADCLPNKNLIFSHMQLWNDCNNAFGMGAETRASVYENIVLKDSEILFSYDDPNHHEKLDERSAMNICALHGTYFKNIRFENVRVNRCERLIGLGFKESFWFGSIRGDQSYEGAIDGVTFKNITCPYNSGSEIANEIRLYGWHKEGTPDKEVKNIVFDEVMIEGKLLSEANDENIKTNNTEEHILVKNIIFNPSSGISANPEKDSGSTIYPTAVNRGESFFRRGDDDTLCQVYSLQGKLYASTRQTEISTLNWPAGIYIFKLYDDLHQHTKSAKVIVY